MGAPIHRASFDALLTAIETTIRQPWLVMDVDEASFKGEDCEGFYKRTMKFNSTGEVVTEHIVVDEEDGEIIYNKGGEVERVAVIHKNPLRLELYQRNTHDKVRKEWELPYAVAKEAMSKFVSMAKEIEERQRRSGAVGYGMQSSPIEYPHDAVWKAMLFWIYNPDKCGMKGDQVKVEDKKGHLLRSMRRISDNRVVTQHVRLNEGAQEILFRTVKKGKESNDECVLALRTEPLRCEYHCRSAKDEMRVLSKEPASSVREIFDCIINAVSPKLGGYGWSTGAIESSVDALWEALEVQAREPEKFMEVTDVKVSDEEGFLLRTMTISANKTKVQENVMINREANEIVYQPIDLETGLPQIKERVIAIKNDPHLHLEYYQRDLSDGMRSPWAVPVNVLTGTVDKLIEIAKVMDETVEPVVGFGFHSPQIADVDHDELWLAMLKDVRHPQAVIIEHEGFLERRIAQPEKVHQNVYVNEHVNEIVFRDLVDGKEQKTERAIVLRDHPLEIEMCERNIHSGFRVHSEMTKKAAKILMDNFVDSAKLSMKTPPTKVGLGVSSAPIHRASFDALLTAIETTIRQPWLVMNVDEASFKGEDCEGFYKRTMKFNSTGEVVTEHVVVDEEDGEIIYSKGEELERVAVIHKNPLRLELYQRNTHDKVRKEWELPYAVAKEAMSKFVSMAKEIEERQSDTVDYGMHTSPIEYPHDAVWKAMLFWIYNPDGCGMKVDQVKVEDKKGHVLRSMRRISDNRVVTQHVRLNEGAQEILFRTVKNGEESNDECVLALRTEPLRCEFHCRSAKDEMRVLSKEPASSVQEIFDCIINAVKDQRA